MPITEYTDVADCQLLLKQDTGVFSDAGVTAAVNNDAIQQWNDQSGNSNHATQTTASKQPTYSTDTRGTVVCVSDHMVLPTSMDRQSASFLIVASFNNTATEYLISAGGTSFIILLDGSSGKVQLFGGGTSTAATFIRHGKPVAILVTMSSTEVAFYVDQTSNPETFGARSAGTYGTMRFGGVVDPTSNYLEVAAWTRALTSQECTDVMTLAMSRNSITATDSLNTHLVCEGDSITAGTGGTLNRNWPTWVEPASDVGIYNCAQGGRQLQNILGSRFYDSLPDVATAFLVVHIGTNDLGAGRTAAQIQADLTTYCNARVTAGFDRSRIVLCTLGIYPSIQSEVTALNAWIRSNYQTIAGRLVDVANDPLIGHNGPGGYGDTANVHYNDDGYEILAGLITDAIPELTGGGLFGSFFAPRQQNTIGVGVV